MALLGQGTAYLLAQQSTGWQFDSNNYDFCPALTSSALAPTMPFSCCFRTFACSIRHMSSASFSSW